MHFEDCAAQLEESNGELLKDEICCVLNGRTTVLGWRFLHTKKDLWSVHP